MIRIASRMAQRSIAIPRRTFALGVSSMATAPLAMSVTQAVVCLAALPNTPATTTSPVAVPSVSTLRPTPRIAVDVARRALRCQTPRRPVWRPPAVSTATVAIRTVMVWCRTVARTTFRHTERVNARPETREPATAVTPAQKALGPATEARKPAMHQGCSGGHAWVR